MSETKKSKLMLVISMLIFGTIGIFRKYIPLPSSVIALSRGITGTLFLLLIIALKHDKPDLNAIKKNLLPLCVSGAFIGFNWILLFEAYNYTSVAVATLCYYMAPILVILIAPFLFNEKLTPKKIICVITALIGMIFVSGIPNTGFAATSELKGVFFGLGAAVLYASVVILNKYIKDISAYDKTIVQLGASAIVLLPYTLLTENITELSVSPTAILLLLIVGIIHTGIAYALYFGSMKALKAQTTALFSYIDPVSAIILSALILNEKTDIYGIAGAVLVLGSTLISELPERKKMLNEKSETL